jgi:endonuclease/exonuclease/phosphatase family metal-dependent hydrolase
MSKLIKVVSWNLGFWLYRKHHRDAWDYLRNVIKPDIVFLQETQTPKLDDDEVFVFREVRQSWGTAIYCRGIRVMREIAMPRYSERIAAAEVEIDHNKSVFIASIHAPIIKNRVFPHMDNIFTDIEAAFSDNPSLIGGDLNSARLAELTWPGFGHAPFFARVDASSFEDVRKRFYQDEIQTVFRPNQSTPFQDDHIFVSRNLSSQIFSYSILDNEVTRTVSDHIPVIVELQV